jgi:multiple sugar transport system permease protein
MIQFIKAIPKDLDEAAIIDGASRLGILWYIIIPNTIPGIVTLAMIEFQFAWNLFYWPLIAVNKREFTMLQVAIAAQSGQAQVYWGRTLAGATVASLPLIIIFLIFQRYYVETASVSGLKG